MQSFRKGDFIRLKKMSDYKIDRFINKEVNVFEIIVIKDEYVVISNCQSKIPLSDIEPILINGIDDLNIYYDPIICASCIAPYEKAPVSKKDCSYFFESFKRHTYKDKNFQEIIKDLGYKYVHEVQHFLFDELNKRKLTINAL
jgi:disulfide oxidoreductase YuzD